MLAQTSELSEAWMTEPRWPHKAVGYGAQFQCALKSHPKFKPNSFIKPKDADDSVGLYFCYYYIKWFIEKKISKFSHMQLQTSVSVGKQEYLLIKQASAKQAGKTEEGQQKATSLSLLQAQDFLLFIELCSKLI